MTTKRRKNTITEILSIDATLPSQARKLELSSHPSSNSAPRSLTSAPSQLFLKWDLIAAHQAPQLEARFTAKEIKFVVSFI